MKNPQYSFSRLDLYERCPWAYKTVHIDKIPRAKSEALQTGTVQVGDMVYGTSRMVSYDLDPEQVTAVLLEAGLAREEVWPLLSITKTNLEKGLRKLRRGDLFDLVFSTAAIKVSEKVDFRKPNS